MSKKTPQRDDNVFIKGMSSLFSQTESLMRTPDHATEFYSSPIEKQKKTEKNIDKKAKIRGELLNKLLLHYNSKNITLSTSEMGEISEYVRGESEKIISKEKTIEDSFKDYIKENGKK